MNRVGPKSPKVKLAKQAKEQKSESKPKKTREEKIVERYDNLTEGKYLNVASLQEVKEDYKYFNYDKANMLAYDNDSEDKYDEVLEVLGKERASGKDLVEATKSKPVKGQGGKKKKRGPKKTAEQKATDRFVSKYFDPDTEEMRTDKKGLFMNVRTTIWIKGKNPHFNYDTDNHLAYENDMRAEYERALKALGLEEGTIIEAEEDPKERKERKKKPKAEKKEKGEKKEKAEKKGKAKAKPKSKRAAIKPKKDEELKEIIEKLLKKRAKESENDKYKGKGAYINLTPTSRRFVTGGQSKYNYDSQGFAYTDDNKEQYEKVLKLLELEPMPEEPAEEEEQKFVPDAKLKRIVKDIKTEFDNSKEMFISGRDPQDIFLDNFDEHLSEECSPENVSAFVGQFAIKEMKSVNTAVEAFGAYYDEADEENQANICEYFREQVALWRKKPSLKPSAKPSMKKVEFKADATLADIATDIATNFNALDALPGTAMRKAMSEDEVKQLFLNVFNEHLVENKCTPEDISRLVQELASQGLDYLSGNFQELYDYFLTVDKLERPAVCAFIREQVMALQEGEAGAEEAGEEPAEGKYGKGRKKIPNHVVSPKKASKAKSLPQKGKKIKISPPRRSATSPKTRVKSPGR